MCLSIDTFGLFELHKQVEGAHFEPMLSNSPPPPPKAERALKMR